MKRKRVELSILRYPKEEKILRGLLSIYPLKKVANLFVKISSYLFEGFLLGEAVKVSPRNYPHIYRISKDAVSTLQLKNPPAVFVVQDPLFIAYTVGVKEKYQIILSSGIVENFTRKEIAFVIGHEIGHIVFDHILFHSIMTFYTLFASSIPVINYILFPSFLPLLAWSRNSEISADRVGLLICRDLKASLNAMMKLSGGKEILKHVSTEEYMKQLELLKSSPGRFLEFFSTHPFLPKRGKALSIFYASPLYRSFFKSQKITPSLKEGVEKEVGRIMRVW